MASIFDNLLSGLKLKPQVDSSGFGQEYLDNPVMTAPITTNAPVAAAQPEINPMAQMFQTLKKVMQDKEYASIFGGNNEQQINEALAERDKIGKFDMKNWLTATLPSLGILALGSIMTRGRGGDPGTAMSNIQQGYQKGVENKAAIDLDTFNKKWQNLQENARSGDTFKKLIYGNILSEGMKEEYLKKKPFEADPTKELWLDGKLKRPATAKREISGNVTTDKDGKKVWMWKDGGASPYPADSVPKEFADKWGEQLRQDKNGKYKWYVYNKLTNEVGEEIRDATEKDLKTGNKANVSFASHSKWDSTIDKELKGLTSRYKLTGSEVLNVDPNNPQALLALFMSKGLTAESAKDFKTEYDRIKEIQALGRDDIEEGKSPYTRLGKKAQSVVKDEKAVISDVIKPQNKSQGYGYLWR